MTQKCFHDLIKNAWVNVILHVASISEGCFSRARLCTHEPEMVVSVTLSRTCHVPPPPSGGTTITFGAPRHRRHTCFPKPHMLAPVCQVLIYSRALFVDLNIAQHPVIILVFSSIFVKSVIRFSQKLR